MNCIAPEEMREGDLLAYLEGRARQGVKEHIVRCPACMAEALALARVDRVLSAALYRAACPATETLLQYQAELLPARARRQVERHVKDCPLCAGELRRLAAFDALQHSVWEEMRRAARTVIEAMRIPPPPHLAIAVRGSYYRPQLYRAGEVDILLGSEALDPSRELWRLRGRLTRGGLAEASWAGSTVRLTHDEKVVASQLVDELGYFSIDGLAAGQYELWLERPEASDDVVVRGVVVGAAADTAEEAT